MLQKREVARLTALLVEVENTFLRLWWGRNSQVEARAYLRLRMVYADFQIHVLLLSVFVNMLWPHVMSRDDVRLWGWAGCSSIIQRSPESGKAAPSSSVWDPSNCLKTFLLPDVEGICPRAAGLFSSDGEGVGLLQEGEPNQVRAPEIVSGKNVSKIPSENLSRESPILVDLNCHVPFKFSYICRKRCKADVWSGYVQIPWLCPDPLAVCQLDPRDLCHLSLPLQQRGGRTHGPRCEVRPLAGLWSRSWMGVGSLVVSYRPHVLHPASVGPRQGTVPHADKQNWSVGLSQGRIVPFHWIHLLEHLLVAVWSTLGTNFSWVDCPPVLIRVPLRFSCSLCSKPSYAFS